MYDYVIYCDDLQEGIWFQNLNSRFADSKLEIIPQNRNAIKCLGLDNVLKYDRPDIILQDNGKTILVLERTVEVPSGHNVGQRYGRILAAAENQIPVIYFGPYAAYKHGGETAGPRYMNLRLFYSLNNVSNKYNTDITTIRWPVDDKYEVLRTPMKDDRLKQYLSLFFSYYEKNGFNGLSSYLKDSKFHQEQLNEQKEFATTEIRNPEQYEIPPESVDIMVPSDFSRRYDITSLIPSTIEHIILYHIGMTYIRSDPYAGMSALYKYLYVNDNDMLVLHFKNIQSNAWYNQRSTSKTYRMYKDMADAILFQDSFIEKDAL